MLGMAKSYNNKGSGSIDVNLSLKITMTNSLLKICRYFFILAMLSLIGCKDTHNKQPSIDINNEGSATIQAVAPTAIAISADEFRETDFTGTWKRRFILHSTKEISLKFGEIDTLALESRVDNYFDVIFIEQINETSVLIKYCDSLPAKLIEIDTENSIIIDSTSDNSIKPTENNRIAKYYKISDDHYRIDLYTNDKLSGYFELEKHPSLLAFDFGMFSFGMTDNVDLNASEDVCGIVDLSTVTLSDSLDDSVTFDPTSSQLNSYSISAPYEGSFVTFKLSFNSAIEKATYNVTQVASTAPLAVMVDISSPEFSASPDIGTTTVINGKSGLVTIDTISDTSIRGNYDLILENGAVLTGDFSFEIK